jgi:hypothetical protein
MKIHPRGKYWWVELRSDGKRIRRSLKIKVHGKLPEPGASLCDKEYQASILEAVIAAYKIYNADVYRKEGFDFADPKIRASTSRRGKSHWAGGSIS